MNWILCRHRLPLDGERATAVVLESETAKRSERWVEAGEYYFADGSWFRVGGYLAARPGTGVSILAWLPLPPLPVRAALETGLFVGTMVEVIKSEDGPGARAHQGMKGIVVEGLREYPGCVQVRFPERESVGFDTCAVDVALLRLVEEVS